MSLLGKLFKKRPEPFLDKGEQLFSADRFYEARLAFEEGLQLCGPSHADLGDRFRERIAGTLEAMAQLNLREAETCIARGDITKAADHLELAKSLSNDSVLREKAEHRLANLSQNINETSKLAPSHSCGSCSQHDESPPETAHHIDESLTPDMHYELLIHQLPPDEYKRYAGLGEDFACAYIAASNDNHELALSLLDKWNFGADKDIYLLEKGKLLHRIGREVQAEQCLREAIAARDSNPLSWLALSLLLTDDGRLPEALACLNDMIAHGHLTEQAVLMRGEVLQGLGEIDAAIADYASLLRGPLARASAERLHNALLHCGRHAEAEHVFKQFLGKCCH